MNEIEFEMYKVISMTEIVYLRYNKNLSCISQPNCSKEA